MLGEGVDAAPSSNDDAVEEFLGAAGAAQPQLTDQKGQGHENAVCDEGATHDEVCETLAQMVALTETLGSDATKQQLDPDNHGESLATDTVYEANPRADASVDAFLEM